MTIKQLQRLARARGIQTSYVNAAGKKVPASRATLEAILHTLAPLECSFEHVYVLWDGKPKRIPINGAAQLQLENGELWPINGSTLPRCPIGYHKLQFTHGESLVISSPSKSYCDTKIGRAWGIFAPMYSLRSRTEGFSTWQSLVEWAHPFGASVLATLPLLASFPSEPSPYSPASRLFWNEFYLDVGIPTTCDNLVNYAKITQAKRAKLEPEAVAFFRKGASAEFERYRVRKRNLDDYAAFRAATEKFGSWHAWSERMRNSLRPGDYDDRTKTFYMYAQWRAQQQMDELLRDCRSKGTKLYLDLPLGVHPHGYDVWAERDSFALDVSAGSPPDPLFIAGQDWGFAPLHPHRLRETHYRHLLDFLRFQMRHTSLLRIDHIMWLHRLYWIPKGRPASEGAYVRYPAEELHAILCLESHRNKTMLVGENLGTVPHEVNESMDHHNLHGTYVLQYEAGPKSRLRPPPPRSVASLNTHDMPTFEAFLRGLDIDDRFDLGLIKKRNLSGEHRRRKKVVARLRKGLGTQGDLLEAALQWLARSEAEILLINIEDLWRETLPQNVPSTSSERPNWQRKLRYSIDQLSANPRIRRLLQIVADARAQSRPTDSSGRVRRRRTNALARR